jgi:hypothetical protein
VICPFPRETLALHVEGDLSGPAATIAASHLAACDDCQRFFEQLRARQFLLKSLRRETVSPSECPALRREVMSIVNDWQGRSGWVLRVERAIMLGFHRRAYAMAAVLFLALVLGLKGGQTGVRSGPEPGLPPVSPVFEGRDTLLRPENYRGWLLVSRTDGLQRSAGADNASSRTRPPAQRVYINPTAYREYARTGRFPEGTVMIWESLGKPETTYRPHKQSPALLASVKDDSRFEGGWGFFDFTAREGRLAARSKALAESSGCGVCHSRDAGTDHVFTQFYPLLRSTLGGADLAVPPEGARRRQPLPSPRGSWRPTVRLTDT